MVALTMALDSLLRSSKVGELKNLTFKKGKISYCKLRIWQILCSLRMSMEAFWDSGFLKYSVEVDRLEKMCI